MARYDLHRFNGGLVVDLQNDLIEIPYSRIVAPLLRAQDAPRPTRQLHPSVRLQDGTFIVAIHLLAATPENLLGQPIANLSVYADEFTRALDLLFQGY